VREKPRVKRRAVQGDSGVSDVSPSLPRAPGLDREYVLTACKPVRRPPEWSGAALCHSRLPLRQRYSHFLGAVIDRRQCGREANANIGVVVANDRDVLRNPKFGFGQHLHRPRRHVVICAKNRVGRNLSEDRFHRGDAAGDREINAMRVDSRMLPPPLNANEVVAIETPASSATSLRFAISFLN